MKKEGFVFGFLVLSLVMFINLVSAQFYGGTIFENVIRYLDPLFLLAIIFFFAIFIGLGAVGPFKYNKGVAGAIAAAGSLLAIYGIDRYGFDYNGLFSNVLFFFPEDILFTFLPILVLAAIGFSWYKIGFGPTFMLAGGFFIFLAIFVDIEEKGVSTIIGIVLLALGAFFLWWRNRKPKLDAWGRPISP